MRILLALSCIFLLLPVGALAGHDGQTMKHQGADVRGLEAGNEGAVARRVTYLQDALLLNGEQAEDLRKILDKIEHNAQSRQSSPGGSGGGHGRHSGRSQSQIDLGQVEARSQEIRASVRAILNDNQLASYDKLVGQEREWWLDPQLMQMDGMLNLSLDQCRQIHPVLRRSRLRIRALRENAADGGDHDAMKKLREEVKESNEVLLEFLDDNQQVIWKRHMDELKKQMEDMRSQQQGMGGRGGGHGGHGGGGGRGGGVRYY